MTAPSPAGPLDIPVGQQTTLTAADTDANGNAINPASSAWSASDNSVTLIPSGLTCVVQGVAPNSPPAPTTITQTATNADGTTALGTFAIEVSADDVVNVVITAGPVVPIAAAAPAATVGGALAGGSVGAAAASAARPAQVKRA